MATTSIRRLTTVLRHHSTTATTTLKTYPIFCWNNSIPSLLEYSIDLQKFGLISSNYTKDDSNKFHGISQIMKNVVNLSIENVKGDICNVYLVGTCHVSKTSCKEVEAVISYLKPQVVFLELCPTRVSLLAKRELKIPTVGEMIDMWKKKKRNVFQIIYSWHLAKVSEKLGVIPGSEFRVAFEEAMKCGSKVILGDRPHNITLRRVWRSLIRLSLWDKIKLLFLTCPQVISILSLKALDKTLIGMNDSDKVTLVIQKLSKACPFLFEAIINQRDQYMSSALLQIAREHTSVVAVVGMGHLQGIRKNWNQPIEVQ